MERETHTDPLHSLWQSTRYLITRLSKKRRASVPWNCCHWERQLGGEPHCRDVHAATHQVSSLPPLPTLIFLSRTHLTQGKVDGSEGRTSFSGLASTLQAILNSLRSALQEPLTVSEEIFSDPTSSSPPTIDLILGGIWKPLSTSLQAQFSGMFITGITTIFHRTYRAIDQFLINLSEICGLKWSQSILNRIKRHESVVSFQQLWKMDLYFKVTQFLPHHPHLSLVAITRGHFSSRSFLQTSIYPWNQFSDIGWHLLSFVFLSKCATVSCFWAC